MITILLALVCTLCTPARNDELVLDEPSPSISKSVPTADALETGRSEPKHQRAVEALRRLFGESAESMTTAAVTGYLTGMAQVGGIACISGVLTGLPAHAKVLLRPWGPKEDGYDGWLGPAVEGQADAQGKLSFKFCWSGVLVRGGSYAVGYERPGVNMEFVPLAPLLAFAFHR
jgi:hypothetical protein